jgi:hypothetical protein
MIKRLVYLHFVGIHERRPSKRMKMEIALPGTTLFPGNKEYQGSTLHSTKANSRYEASARFGQF